MMANNRRFAVFILSHGRADRVYTYQALRECGYTGQIYIVCDDEDIQLPRYLELYGDSVIVFNKQESINNTDSGDNLKKRNSVVYARNRNFQIAAELGLTHFVQLDDDYELFGFISDDRGRFLGKRATKSLDSIISAVFDFLDESGAYAVALAQNGDYVGGRDSNRFRMAIEGKFLRKAMNAFFFQGRSSG